MSYCLYVRKSRADVEAEAHGEGETLARHTNALLELAKRRHLGITQIYREIVSGESIAARPVMQQLLSEVERGLWDGVLVMEVERLARGDTIDQGVVAQTFKISNTKIITPIKDYDPNNEYDEEYFEFGLFMSRREYKTINRRLQRGRLASVKEGKYVGSIPPYGYDKEKLKKDKGYKLIPLQPEADIVKLVFHLFTVGEADKNGVYHRLGISLITRKLNDMHISPRKNQHWSPSSIRDMIKNPVYNGKLRWNWRPESKKMLDGNIITERCRMQNFDCMISDGLHEPLVSEQTFNLAQNILKTNQNLPVRKDKKVKNPLSGLIVCAKCGHNMVRRPFTGRGVPDTLMCPDTSCDNVSAQLSIVETAVLKALRNLVDEHKIKWEKQQPKIDESGTALKEKVLEKLKAELETLNRQIDNTHDLLEQGIYSTDEFLERSKKLSERIKKNELDRITIEKEIQSEQEIKINQELIIPKIENLLAVYECLDSPKEKNDLLKEVLSKVSYYKAARAWKGGNTENFDIVLYPAVPMK